MLKRLAVILPLLVCAALGAVHAQQLEWSVDLTTMFQNREGGDEQTPDQTILFTRLAPEVGLSLMDSTHVIKGGVAWYQPMIDNGAGYKVLPTIYYNYHHGKWDMTTGVFPRSLLPLKPSTLLWSDSLSFTTPNARGVLIRHQSPTCDMALMVDWRQMQSTTQREAFNVYFQAAKNFDAPVALLGEMQINHLAKRKDAPEGEGVNDDITLFPRFGVWVVNKPKAKLTVEVGPVVQLQRNRSEGKWHTPCRFFASANARLWNWLDIDQEFSIGKDAFPLYDQFGNQLNLGDPYWRSKTYSRTDVKAHIVNNRFVDLNAGVTLHATDKTFGFWQQISCRVYIDQGTWKHRRDKRYLNSRKLSGELR